MRAPRIVRQIGKRVVNATPFLRRHLLSSSDYRVLTDIDEARGLMSSSGGWLSHRTVERQEHAYRGLISAMKAGDVRLDLKVAATAIAATGLDNPHLLEVGCGSGYYSEVLVHLLSGGIRYRGADYSPAMVARARARYPRQAFDVADATRLPYADDAFDVVFNGVSLMHILDYPAAIREAARVASRYCVFHSVPVFDDRGTTFLTKYAYGSPVIEIIFSEKELMSLCADAKLRFEHVWPSIAYDVFHVTGHHCHTRTYLFSIG